MKTTAKDIRELSRRLKPEACTITRIAGAYVDAEKTSSQDSTRHF